MTAITATVAACGGTSSAVASGPLAKPVVAPDLTGPLLNGGSFVLSTLRGQVVVLNFWASWCPPCRAETPLLAADAKADAARGVSIVGIDEGDSRADALAFRRSVDATYPTLFDPNSVDLAKFRHVNPSAIPVTLVLNRAGGVAARFEGGISGAATAQFDQVLATLEAQPA